MESKLLSNRDLPHISEISDRLSENMPIYKLERIKLQFPKSKVMTVVKLIC
ncbi:MAG TPA: hypothetical protein VK184_09685 [Nostocaceae cyanobacterium]|nr:hypothetical protein [Nostocaceae cyanobacterium]